LGELEAIISDGPASLEVRVACEVEASGQGFPIYVITLGNPHPDNPAVGFFGGFHGLERIGSEVVTVYLKSLLARLRWDSVLHRQLETVRLVFMPLTLEMGSWLWVKKNPRQLLSRQGIFNPLIEHRLQRVLRRHLSWLDFLGRAASGYRRWLPTAEQRAWHDAQALSRWYRGAARE